MFNKDIRIYAKEKGVFFWQIAKVMGVSEPTMTRRLRSELSEQDKQTFRHIIDELSAQNNNTREE
jgi:hypothetical protein